MSSSRGRRSLTTTTSSPSLTKPRDFISLKVRRTFSCNAQHHTHRLIWSRAGLVVVHTTLNSIFFIQSRLCTAQLSENDMPKVAMSEALQCCAVAVHTITFKQRSTAASAVASVCFSGGLTKFNAAAIRLTATGSDSNSSSNG